MKLVVLFALVVSRYPRITTSVESGAGERGILLSARVEMEHAMHHIIIHAIGDLWWPCAVFPWCTAPTRVHSEFT
jgi:hypothetical protein